MGVDRNSPCLCGSGKKYKKCCANKNTVQICYDNLPEEEASINFPPLLPEDQKIIDTLPEKVIDEDSPFFKTLFALKEKYPENPSILGHLVNGYARLGENEKMYTTIRQMHDKFPSYLFGITAETLACLNKGDLERAREILGKYRSLQELYPKRELFHISELSTFHHAKAQCACREGDKAEAAYHLSALEKALPVDDELLKEVKQAVARLP